MKQYKGYGNYEKHPAIQIDTPACTGTQAIAEAIRARCTEKEATGKVTLHVSMTYYVDITLTK